MARQCKNGLINSIGVEKEIKQLVMTKLINCHTRINQDDAIRILVKAH